MKIKLFFILVIIFCVPNFCLAESLDAEENEASIKNKHIENAVGKLEERAEKIEEKKNQLSEKRCLTLQRRFKARHQFVIKKTEAYLKRLDKIVNKLEAIVEKLENLGCDSMELKNDLKAIESYNLHIQTSLQNFKTKVDHLEIDICDSEKKEEYKTKAEEIKQHIQEIREKHKNIRDTFKRSFMEHVKDVKTECRDKISQDNRANEINN